MSLLTPTNDLHTFSSYLPMDHSANTNSDWPMYSTADFVPDIGLQGTEALAKATKDLMSLDADRWPSSSTVPVHGQQMHYTYYPQQQPQQQYGRYDVQQQYHQQQPRRNVTFPFLATKQEYTQLHPLSINTVDANPTYSGLPTPTTASSSSNSSYNFNPSPMMTSPTSPTHSVRLSRSPGLAPSIKRRSLDSAVMQQSHKRSRLTPPHSALPYSRPSVSPAPVVSSKPPLLSPDQKKANHIQSEQKRRANIRRGYEALCETVPALREAIRAEEEAASNSREKSSRSRRAKAKAKDDGSGEKLDGRAGPRSENVVLMKTIEYINDLSSERSDLLSRLERAKSLLGQGHPALVQSEVPALWDREWKGGAGSEGEEEEESD